MEGSNVGREISLATLSTFRQTNCKLFMAMKYSINKRARGKRHRSRAIHGSIGGIAAYSKEKFGRKSQLHHFPLTATCKSMQPAVQVHPEEEFGRHAR
mmetsp:Transcript_33765/g.57356  ORF Transcript_33765/g.57356 Transcript_33765/m.57356 type:complete len:98 (+) Transcript_33765:276-569(+)